MSKKQASGIRKARARLKNWRGALEDGPYMLEFRKQHEAKFEKQKSELIADHPEYAKPGIIETLVEKVSKCPNYFGSTPAEPKVALKHAQNCPNCRSFLAPRSPS